MTTNKTLFKSKEHYQAFRKAWSNAVNSKELTVSAAHMVLYNILRGKDYHCGFTPVTRSTKLRNGFLLNGGLHQAVYDLKWRMNEANIENFISIFDGTVDVEMAKSVTLPDCKPMYSNFGPYKKVAEYIVNCHTNDDALPTTIQHIESIRDALETEAA